MIKGICFILCAFLIVSCAGKGTKGNIEDKEEQSLSTITTNYVKATMGFQYDEAKKYVAKEKIASYDEAKDKYEGTNDGGLEIIRDIINNETTKFTVIDKKISEDKNSAEITVKISTRSSIIKDRIITLIKENDEWKVNENFSDVASTRGSYSQDKGFFIDDTEND
jgi:hypothetical protein